MPQTLRVRLAAVVAGSILAAIAVFGVVTVLLVSHQLHSSLDRALRQRAQEVAQLAVSAPAVLTDPGALESPASGREIAVEVVDARGRILARSLTLGVGLLPQDRLALQARAAGRTGFEDVEIDRRPFRLYAAPIAQAGGPAAGGAVLVASDTHDLSSTIGSLGVLVAVSGAGVALLAALAAAALTRRGLRPLRRLAVAAGEIERTADPAQRLPEPATVDEIGQLTGVLNRMLSSLEQARASERRFLADASHELRTPVTTLLGNAEYAVRHGADPEVLQELRDDAAGLARLVDSLLLLERAGGAMPVLEPVELGSLVRAAVTDSDPSGERVRIGQLDEVHVRADAEAMRRVLANLIENGLVHGPTGGRVTVTLTRASGGARLTVSDQGLGPDPAQRDQIFERFWRGPGAAERSGSGLGLSIVAAVVERHGGRVSVQDARFTVELPAATASGG
jgi:two-component system, OmpR family, sensor kinase